MYTNTYVFEALIATIRIYKAYCMSIKGTQMWEIIFPVQYLLT